MTALPPHSPAILPAQPFDALLDLPDDTRVHTLSNGVRLLVIHQPGAPGVSVSVFLRSGGQHEPARWGGISHVIEHMAFKGSATRNCQQINLDAERLGAEVNAHTDRDHTAYQMRGLAAHTLPLLRMLADLVLHPTFPQEELDRERQVILHELTDVEDDAYAVAWRLFDQAAYGRHPFARPVIGSRSSIEKLTRQDLLDHLQQRCSGSNLIVAVAGPLPAEALLAEVEAGFGHLAAGAPNQVEPARWIGGVRIKRHGGSSQSQVVLGWPIARLDQLQPADAVAAAVLGEGMSSPMLDELRERRGLAYHINVVAEQQELGGQFVVEGATSPEQLPEFLEGSLALLRRHADRVEAIDLERARHQLLVRSLHDRERPMRRLEEAAVDLFVLGRLRGNRERLEALQSVDREAVRSRIETLLLQPPALAITGRAPAGTREHFAGLLKRFELPLDPVSPPSS
ncbi:MAG: insulinase family protein [Burkholderiales bacterium]|nr:insulinase family protein [Burkholderiales bacterium]